jgi:hypothetical protein
MNANQLPFHGTSYHNFINAIKSSATRAGYETSIMPFFVLQKEESEKKPNIECLASLAI